MNLPKLIADKPWSWALAAIVGAACLLRLWGIRYGLPYVYWVDEYHEVMRALELGSGEFNFARTGKGGFYFLLFFEYGLYFVLQKIAGAVETVQDFADGFVRDPTAFYLMGRATAALFGCATVAAAFWIGRRAYQPMAGLFAALFLAVNVAHVDLSHRVGVDVPMTFFATIALYFAIAIVECGTRKEYLLAGLFAGLATTTKLPGLLVLLPLFVAHLLRNSRGSGSRIGWVLSRDLWLAALTFFAVLACTNPGILLHFDPMSFYAPPAGDGGVADADSDAGALIARPNLYLYYVGVLVDSMGWPLFALSILAAVHAAWKRNSSDVILLSYALVNYIAISSTSSEVLFYPRYALPIIVVLAIVSGRTLAAAAERMRGINRAALPLIAAILVAWPLATAALNAIAFTNTDSRTLAKEWMDANVPEGSRVLIEGSKIAASRLSVPLSDSRDSLDGRIAYWESKEPKQAKYLKIVRRVRSDGGYRLEFMQIGAIETLETYVAHGVEYVVVRPDYMAASRRSKGDGARLMESLRQQSKAELVKRIVGETRNTPGPTVEIYRIKSSLGP